MTTQKPRSFIRRATRKLFLLFAVSVIWIAVSVFTSTMLSTATFSPSEADGIVEGLKASDANMLWALIIPTCFFLVIATRPKNNR